MYINRFGELKVRIRGVDTTIRSLAETSEGVRKAARRGCKIAATYLKMVIEEKFGHYQRTGGPGGGKWPRLKPQTRAAKKRDWFKDDDPLVASGDTQDSLYVRAGGQGTLAYSVATTSPILIHHIFGAPRAHLPPRDLFLISAVEERDQMHELIMEEVNKAMAKLK